MSSPGNTGFPRFFWFPSHTSLSHLYIRTAHRCGSSEIRPFPKRADIACSYEWLLRIQSPFPVCQTHIPASGFLPGFRTLNSWQNHSSCVCLRCSSAFLHLYPSKSLHRCALAPALQPDGSVRAAFATPDGRPHRLRDRSILEIRPYLKTWPDHRQSPEKTATVRISSFCTNFHS